MQRGIGTLLILFSLSCLRAATAQQTHQEKDSAGSIWLAYVGEHSISQKWNLHLEGQFFSYGTQTPELLFLRPGFRREFSHGISGLITYAYFLKYPAITNTSRPLPEHRISEDIQWRHPFFREGVKRATLAHRLRMEQRFEGQENSSDHNNLWNYAERLRYRITANLPLPGNTDGPRPDYVSFYNEVFINFGRRRGKQALDQNIVSGVIGWNLTSHLQFDIGYLLEYFPSGVGSVGNYNHVVQMNLNSTFPFSRKKRRELSKTGTTD